MPMINGIENEIPANNMNLVLRNNKCQGIRNKKCMTFPTLIFTNLTYPLVEYIKNLDTDNIILLVLVSGNLIHN